MLPARLTLALVAALAASACVPTTPQAPAAPPVETKSVYLATSDNGIAVPAVPVEKVPDEFERQVVEYPTGEAPGTIVINPATKHLYFVTGRNQAIRYGISVGREGFQWSGVANVTDRKPWPTWTPPPEMIERDPKLAKWEKGQPGGPTNPLGARALYLTTDGRDYGYRIHGTPEWSSIGRNASSGCIRMINQDVMDLYQRVPPGAKVIVLTREGRMPTGLTLPPPQPKKPKPAAAPAEAAAPVVVPAVADAAAAPEAASQPGGAGLLPAASPAASTGAPGTETTPAAAAVPPAASFSPAPATAVPVTAVSPAPASGATPVATPLPAAAPTCVQPQLDGTCPKP